MRRNVSLSEISDGKLYHENDMVKADCHGCEGCSDCCAGMGNSIILDPYDAFRLSVGLGRDFAELIEKEVELNVVDGIILPNLKMSGPKESCAFLDAQGRCGIHAFRPGICRLFPLGRYYENGDFSFFLQTGECKATRTKIKVNKWIDTPDFKRNKAFILTWHYLLNDLEAYLEKSGEEALAKQMNLRLLQLFYFTPYDSNVDFYEQFEKRKKQFVTW